MTKYSKVIDLNNILSIKIINHRLRQIVRDAICLRKVVWYIYLSTSMRLDLWFTLTGLRMYGYFARSAVQWNSHNSIRLPDNMPVAMATTLESRYKGEIG